MYILCVYTHRGAVIVQGVRQYQKIAESVDNAYSFCDFCVGQSGTADSVNMKSNGTD